MQKSLWIIAGLSIATAAHAEEWYYINLYPAKGQSECVRLKDGDLPVATLARAYGMDSISVGQAAEYPDGTHTLMFIHKAKSGETFYNFADTLAGCRTMRSELRQGLDVPQQKVTKRQKPTHEIGLFPGNGEIDPIMLTDDLCVTGRPDLGKRALFRPGDGDYEACWRMTDRTATGLYAIGGQMRVVLACLRVDGKRDGLVTGNCRWIDKSEFQDPTTLPKTARIQ